MWVRTWKDGEWMCGGAIWRRKKVGERGVRGSIESLLNLIGIHPGRGAEEPCRKATVIYEHREQPRCS